MIQTKKKPVLVLGGTGHYGRYIVKNLLEKGENVRVLSRNINKARNKLGNKVDIIEGDIRTNVTVEKCLNNVKGIIISISAFTPNQIRNIELYRKRFNIICFKRSREKKYITNCLYIGI